MSIPHDFYKYDPDHPELHNRGEGRHYLEPDWHATRMDAQLPALSAIGRGPRGEGLFVGATVNQDGQVSFTLNSTLTGEVVWESPNLAPSEIEFNTVSWRDLVPGVAAPLDITVKRGGTTKTTKAWLPPGQVGSLVYLLGGDPVAVRDDHTYTTTVADLTIFGKKQYQNKPVPRPNDIVMFQYDDDGVHGLGVGIVENVGGTTRENYNGGDIPTPTNVVFTANIYIPAVGDSSSGGQMKTLVLDLEWRDPDDPDYSMSHVVSPVTIPWSYSDVVGWLDRGIIPVIICRLPNLNPDLPMDTVYYMCYASTVETPIDDLSVPSVNFICPMPDFPLYLVGNTLYVSGYDSSYDPIGG